MPGDPESWQPTLHNNTINSDHGLGWRLDTYYIVHTPAATLAAGTIKQRALASSHREENELERTRSSSYTPSGTRSNFGADGARPGARQCGKSTPENMTC